jgi:hypothetical protein
MAIFVGTPSFCRYRIVIAIRPASDGTASEMYDVEYWN